MISIFAQSVTVPTNYLPVFVGGGVACVVLASFAIFMGKATRRKAKQILQKNDSGTWVPPEGSGADRRTAVRRDGCVVPVILNSAVLHRQSETAFVVDRSTGGLKIVCENPVPEGSTLQVRAENAPDSIPWVTVVVRSCRESGKSHELGCEFEKTPPWNVLLLFG